MTDLNGPGPCRDRRIRSARAIRRLGPGARSAGAPAHSGRVAPYPPRSNRVSSESWCSQEVAAGSSISLRVSCHLKLREKARVILIEQADVVDPVASHAQPLQPP